MPRFTSLASAILTLLIFPTVCSAQVQFKGTVTFQWFGETFLIQPANGKRPVPKDTWVELFKRLGRKKPTSVAVTKVTDDKGSYAFPAINPNPGDVFFIQIYLSTLQSDPAKKQKEFRIHGQGFDWTHIVANDFYVETKNFDAARQNAGVSTINCHFGDLADRDGTNADGYERNELSVNPDISFLTDKPKVDEVYAARYAAVVVVLDQNYRDIEASNKIKWWSDMPKPPGTGLVLFSPLALTWIKAGGVTVPHMAVHALSIQLDSDSLEAATAAHEFGHFLHYHTTEWTVPDLAGEAFKLGHWQSQKSDPKVAYAEGFAEFYSAVWMRQYANKLVIPNWPYYGLLRARIAVPWDPWIDPENQKKLPDEYVRAFSRLWKGGPRSAPLLLDKTNKLIKVNGTDNSGELVEGAVAQALFAMQGKPAPPNFVAAAIEPVWQVLRAGASQDKGKITYNPIKSMHTDDSAKGFYDTFMLTNSDAGAGPTALRQKFRNACNVRGIVYSRMKFSKLLDGDKKLDVKPGIEWANPKTRFQLIPMTHSELNTRDNFVGVIRNAGLYIYDKGDRNAGTAIKRDFHNCAKIALPGADLADVKFWTLFDNTLTNGNKYVGGELNVAGRVAGMSLYYVIRGAVIKDEVALVPNSFSQDQLAGPILGDCVGGMPLDASGLLSAE